MPSKKQLYYAHPMESYGTGQEKADLKMMKKLFPGYVIYNPNCRDAKIGHNRFGFEFFLRKVRVSDLVIFRSICKPPLHDLWDGLRDIGAGVAKEVLAASERGIPVLEVPWDHKIAGRALSVEATRAHIIAAKASR